MGRNKVCGQEDLPTEAIMVVAEMKPETLSVDVYTAKNNVKWYPR